MKYHQTNDVLLIKLMVLNVLNEELIIKNYVEYMIKKLVIIVINMGLLKITIMIMTTIKNQNQIKRNYRKIIIQIMIIQIMIIQIMIIQTMIIQIMNLMKYN